MYVEQSIYRKRSGTINLNRLIVNRSIKFFSNLFDKNSLKSN